MGINMNWMQKISYYSLELSRTTGILIQLINIYEWWKKNSLVDESLESTVEEEQVWKDTNAKAKSYISGILNEMNLTSMVVEYMSDNLVYESFSNILDHGYDDTRSNISAFLNSEMQRLFDVLSDDLDKTYTEMGQIIESN